MFKHQFMLIFVIVKDDQYINTYICTFFKRNRLLFIINYITFICLQMWKACAKEMKRNEKQEIETFLRDSKLKCAA